MKNLKIFFTLLLLSIPFIGCKKGFLDEKPSTSIVEPITLNDLTMILDNNYALMQVSPSLPMLSDDDLLYIDFERWKSGSATERNSYIWSKDIYEGEVNIRDWAAPFTAIYYANTALANLDKVKLQTNDFQASNYVKGWALFIRAYNYYNLATTFCKTFDPITAESDLGLPLRRSPHIDEIEARSTLKATYDFILNDLEEATKLFGSKYNVPTANKNRPSLASVYALKSRIYLSMREYQSAESAADQGLHLYSTLIDFNTLSLTSRNPFTRTNAETLYTTADVSYPAIVAGTGNAYTLVNPSLSSSYKVGDLRSKIFLKIGNGGYVMGGNFVGPSVIAFTGLATDELYLIMAECAARRGEVIACMKWLNNLLIKRFSTGAYRELTATTAEEALSLALLERRKELVRRGLRWTDLKRLNKEGANIVLTRSLNGIDYTLVPNDPKYVFPIPNDEISLSGMQQNQR